MRVKIGKNTIYENHQTYFVVDVGANHDGSSSVEKIKPKRCKYLELNVSKISKYLNTNMPTSKEVIRNLISI